MGLLDPLRLPETKGLDLDDPATPRLHAEIINRKPFLRRLYLDFYRELARSVEGPRIVELGSGGGFLREVIPHAITSDIQPVPGVDHCFSATDMPFEDGSIDGFVMFDVLHHINDPRAFFAEMLRCLRPGGRVAMIEPANTLWGGLMYRKFHHEPYAPGDGWELCGEGALSCANLAMPWIIFERDRAEYEREFPSLKVLSIRHHTPFRYLISGGLSLRQLLPGFLYTPVKVFEWLLGPLNRGLGLFMTVVLQKDK